MKLGIDIGSTTVKIVVMNAEEVVYKRYERHMSNVLGKVKELFFDMKDRFVNQKMSVVITGSGGLALAELLKVKFEQEVIACSSAIEQIIPQTDVAIELGGEDAKITFYGQTIEQQMNGTCAGGTGAFIDQMATLLNTDAMGLNEAAKEHKMIYPIAARCGVFAKTDIQPLINEGAQISDLAASIFQAVVTQTISGLACGRPIRGNVAFLGGPLSYLSELRKRFIDTLHLTGDEAILPNDSKYFVAIGAAIMSEGIEEINIEDLYNKLKNIDASELSDTKHDEPLFADKSDYLRFKARHDKDKIKRKDIKKAKGKVYLGIDAGSTTTKAALIDEDKNLLFDYYKSNEGKPLEITMQLLRKLYNELPKDAYIANTCVTGYGEGLVKSAFKADMGEIETMAHYKGAAEFLPEVDFILDIGGQDMKCMKIKDDSIYSIMLNEACSSGCGSFIETFAKSVNMDAIAFSKEALFADSLVDLGTRCTVFMNSKVKQAQKEGASIADISAGLSYSVIKNALYKVIKLRNSDEAGDHIVVQGGTFLNDSVLRSMEKIVGKNVTRPDIAGLMGAYGAAIIAIENYVSGTESSIIKSDEIDDFEVKTSHVRCGRCENNCLMTINKFNNGERFITGNRCEKGEGKVEGNNVVPDLYDYKMKRLFGYEPLSEEASTRGVVGIPRVLNMYENYPFWFTMFTKLGFSVKLSPQSSKEIYERGIETIPSESACYPAKIVHGHIDWLVKNGTKFIFYPAINYEREEFGDSQNHYNCPIVATYSEVIASNMDELIEENDVNFMHPFLPYDDDNKLAKELTKVFSEFRIPKKEIEEAVSEARKEDQRFKGDVKKQGEYALKYAKDNNKKCIVLAGRPYHLDPEINHGINKVITSLGMVVLSEDAVAYRMDMPQSIRVLDQWMYHSRLYKAANYVSNHDNIEIIQLNSFGCGLDAVTMDQVEEITSAHNKLYTSLKIDEGSNLGAAKIRIRSLMAAMEEREKKNILHEKNNSDYDRTMFEKEMKKDYTILIPQMSPLHFQFLEPALQLAGYKAKMLPAVDTNSVNAGLKYINNDACYPTIVTLGQIISFLQNENSGLDLNKTAVFMSQTGGGCRASNYATLLRKALSDMGMNQIPVVTVSVGTNRLESNPGFNLTIPLVKRILIGFLYGDTLMRILYKTRPYELEKGSANELAAIWSKIAIENVKDSNIITFKRNIKAMVNDFDKLPLVEGLVKPRVGVVGEILVKYHPNANNNIVDVIEKEGGEAVVLEMLDFFLYGMFSKNYNNTHLSGSFKDKAINNFVISFLEQMRKPTRKALRESERFEEPAHISETADKASNILSLGNQCGEGWLLTGEMAELIESGIDNIVCLQPFGCLPNHVTGKGMLKSIRKEYPKANIAAIDYDPGASAVNQLNRIKLMMSGAHKKLEKNA